MVKGKNVIKNSMMGLISQATTILFTFVTRYLFVKYIGIELLGLNSTFTSLLGTLSLAELGFQSAITYSLYKPIHDNDKKMINDIMNIFKLVYRVIGLLFIVGSLVTLPLLKYILKGVEITNLLYCEFLLQAAASTCSYFLAYKRALLYADQRDYISKTIDLIVNSAFNIVQCITVVLTKNYEIYLILKIAQVYCSNYIVHVYCNKFYSYLHRDKLNREKLKEIWGNVKNVFAGKMASYIYSSTDNLVISAFVSTVSVGYLVNYTTITKSLRMLTQSVLSPVVPMLGNNLVEDKNSNSRENIFRIYTLVRYLISTVVIIPLVILVDNFISIWVGDSMCLAHEITVLLAIEFYMDLVHSASADFINGAGLFREDKYIEAAGAAVNIVSSIILVRYYGIAGVLAGTVVSQMVFWIGRSFVVYRKCLKLQMKSYFQYWIRNIVYGIVFVACYELCKTICGFIQINNAIECFVLRAFVCEILVLVSMCGVFLQTNKGKLLFALLRKKRA